MPILSPTNQQAFYSPGYNRPFKLVAQEDRYGCAIASLAMIFDTSYQEMRRRFSSVQEERTGKFHDPSMHLTYWSQVHNFLESLGVSIDIHINPGSSPQNWYPELKAPASLVAAFSSPIAKDSRVAHIVVALRSGVVLDPKGFICDLSSFYYLDTVIGVLNPPFNLT